VAFWLHRPRVTVTCEGSGVHWHCEAATAVRRCKVVCFDANGPEFLTSFHAEADVIAWGRSSSRTDTAGAVRLWLAGAELAEVSRWFPFVDANRRAFVALRHVVLAADPRVEERVSAQIVHDMCDLHYLRFDAEDRAARLWVHGRNPHPDAVLLWDECTIARTLVVDVPAFARIVGRWLVDRAAPSTVQREFPWLELRPEAPYYEAGRPIEGEFLTSWDDLVDFYLCDGGDTAPILTFLALLRDAGFARTLRAGQSMTSAILSRSRRHGLRPEQPCVVLQPWHDAIYVDAEFAGVSRLQCPFTGPSPAVLDLLHALAALPID
jgi:hypothetical protein